MKLTTGILAVAVTMGTAWAQNPDANHNQGNAAPAVPAQRTVQAKPTPGAPAPAVKPAEIPGAKAAAVAKPVTSVTPKVKAAPAKAAKAPLASAAGQPNRLEGVHAVLPAEYHVACADRACRAELPE